MAVYVSVKGALIRKMALSLIDAVGTDDQRLTVACVAIIRDAHNRGDMEAYELWIEVKSETRSLAREFREYEE